MQLRFLNTNLVPVPEIRSDQFDIEPTLRHMFY